MNADRVARRNRILIDMWWRAKSRHHGTQLRPGRFDDQTIANLIATEEATFVEVKAAIRWVFVDDASKHWANNLADLAGFAKAYREICDQLDGWLPGAQPAARAPQGAARVGADHIAAQPRTPEAKAAAEAEFNRLTGEGPPRLTVVEDIESRRHKQ